MFPFIVVVLLNHHYSHSVPVMSGLAKKNLIKVICLSLGQFKIRVVWTRLTF